MRTQILALFVMSVGMLAPACPPSPQTPDAGDAGPGPLPIGDASTSSTHACANLAAVGCVEGTAADCGAVIDRAIATRITRVDLACLTTAKTKSAARTCGFVACQ